jgi:hypothetical protein
VEQPSFFQAIADHARTYEIDSAAATITVRTPDPGKFFRVHHLWLQAEGAGDVQVRSGSTDLSGPIAFAANAEKEWKSDSGLPVFKGRAVAEAFVIANPSTVQINGFAVLTESDR